MRTAIRSVTSSTLTERLVGAWTTTTPLEHSYGSSLIRTDSAFGVPDAVGAFADRGGEGVCSLASLDLRVGSDSTGSVPGLFRDGSVGAVASLGNGTSVPPLPSTSDDRVVTGMLPATTGFGAGLQPLTNRRTVAPTARPIRRHRARRRRCICSGYRRWARRPRLHRAKAHLRQSDRATYARRVEPDPSGTGSVQRRTRRPASHLERPGDQGTASQTPSICEASFRNSYGDGRAYCLSALPTGSVIPKPLGTSGRQSLGTHRLEQCRRAAQTARTRLPTLLDLGRGASVAQSSLHGPRRSLTQGPWLTVSR